MVVYRPHDGFTWETLAHERESDRSFLRGHVFDVYDVAWSPDSTQLLSGSVDRTAIVWDVAGHRQLQQLQGHSNFVQGVAWDPLDKFIATQASDRTARVYAKSAVVATNGKKSGVIPVFTEVTTTATKRRRLFVDETLPSFFRRLAWSPDGSLLLSPAGLAAPAPAPVPAAAASLPTTPAPAADPAPGIPAVPTPTAAPATADARFVTHLFARESWAM